MLQKLSRPLDGAKQSTPRMRDPAARRFEEGHRLLIISSCLFSYTPWHGALPAGNYFIIIRLVLVVKLILLSCSS